MDFLFNIIIYPLKFIIEFSYSVFNSVFKNPGFSILGVSLAVTLMCLPLYIIAEKWEEIERNIQTKLKPDIAHIKKYFKGDEQYMVLNTFYKQNNYHPMMALRSSFSLLIQIPFFIAAYSYISHLSLLEGESFLMIKDMSKPDALISLGNLSLNILPIIMTFINCASGFIYTKGHGIREKIQIYGMALLFLFVLYDSPSGLVIYWTMNQVFSFLKNVFFKIKNPEKVFYICFVIAIIFVDVYLLYFHDGSFNRRLMMMICISLFIFAPFAIKFIRSLLKNQLSSFVNDNNKRNIIFFCSAITLSILNGFIIPSSIVNSSIIEFSNIDDYGCPTFFIWNTFVQCIGLFIFWPTCIYFLFNKNVKTILSVSFFCITLCSLLNTFVFIGNYGTLSRLLTFDASIMGKTSLTRIVLNIVCILAIILVVIIISKYKLIKILSGIISIATFTCITATVIYNIKITSEYQNIKENTVTNEKNITPKLHLSKNGKNVVLFMMDRMESAFFDSIFDEDKELNEIYSGFTFYPNTISYGSHTIFGAPPVFGGYEYTPLEMNKRSSEKLVDKHNESLKVLPKIFGETLDYNVYISDTSWANYSWIADMSIFEGMKNVTPLNIEHKYSDLWFDNNKDKVKQNIVSNTLKRNFLWLSLFRGSPLILRDAIYDDGQWWNTDESNGDMQEFIDFYSGLDYLTKLTDFSSQKDVFINITNDTTHSGIKLNPKDYVPAVKITEKGTGIYSEVNGYSGNIAAFKLLGKWIKLLKENDCYDNTKIIIVSDHGIGEWEFIKDFKGDFDSYFNRDHLHPMLFVKDFNESGQIKKDYSFMTNADVPLIALKGIIENPINPYTNKELTNKQKDKYGAIVTTNESWSPDNHSLTTFKIKDNEWFTVKNDIFDSKNWKKGIEE